MDEDVSPRTSSPSTITNSNERRRGIASGNGNGSTTTTTATTSGRRRSRQQYRQLQDSINPGLLPPASNFDVDDLNLSATSRREPTSSSASLSSPEHRTSEPANTPTTSGLSVTLRAVCADLEAGDVKTDSERVTSSAIEDPAKIRHRKWSIGSQQPMAPATRRDEGGTMQQHGLANDCLPVAAQSEKSENLVDDRGTKSSSSSSSSASAVVDRWQASVAATAEDEGGDRTVTLHRRQDRHPDRTVSQLRNTAAEDNNDENRKPTDDRLCAERLPTVQTQHSRAEPAHKRRESLSDDNEPITSSGSDRLSDVGSSTYFDHRPKQGNHRHGQQLHQQEQPSRETADSRCPRTSFSLTATSTSSSQNDAAAAVDSASLSPPSGEKRDTDSTDEGYALVDVIGKADTDHHTHSIMNSADRPKNALLPTSGSVASTAVCTEQPTPTSSSSSSSSASSSSTSLPEYRRSISTPNAAICSKSAATSETATVGRPQHQQQSLDSMLGISSVVHICINDVSVDGLETSAGHLERCDANSVDSDACGAADDDDVDDGLDVEAMRCVQRRRLSWCPEDDRKREETHMLAVSGRSQSLSSLDGQDDDDEGAPSNGAAAVACRPQDSRRLSRDSTGVAHERSPLSSGQVTSTQPVPISGNQPASESIAADSGRDRWKTTDARRLKNVAVCNNESLLDEESGASSDTGSIALHPDVRSPQRDRSRSVIELVSEPHMLDQLENSLKKFKAKEEKPSRRDSVFSKISSYRQKWMNDKNAKSFKNSHQFVPISFSNSTSCDVCSKPLLNKAALQCENCTVNVHENSCKDQTTVCPRFSKNALAGSQSLKDGKKSNSSPTSSPSTLRGTQSLREGAISTPPLLIQVSSAEDTGRNTTAITSASSSENVHAGDDAVDGLASQLHAVSLDSLEDIWSKLSDLADEDDADLLPKEKEPEAWSVTVDVKTVKRMNSKDIKRQDHIWELIQTEKSHYRTMKMMQKVFAQSMLIYLGIPRSIVDQIFPSLDILLDIHRTFLRNFTNRQSLKTDQSVEEIGDLLYQQFGGQMGIRMKKAYGDFCSKHLEAVTVYKDLLKNDRKFQHFIAKCSRNSLCKRLEIPECILLVTQRVSKYPLLIEPIIKTTKEANSQERELLQHSLRLSQDIARYVNQTVDWRVKERRLTEICRRIDPKSYTTYKNEKFTKADMMNKRKLYHDSSIKWMSARGKSVEVLAVILSDIMVFLSENNQKYTFFSQDNKPCVVSLSKLLVREKGDTKDSKGVYLICPSPTEPEMYELACRSMDERRQWITVLKEAISKCSREDFSSGRLDSDDDQLMQEIQSTKLNQFIDELHDKDRLIQTACDEKHKLITDLFEALSGPDAKFQRNNSEEDNPEAKSPNFLLQLIMQLETSLFETAQSNVSMDQDDVDSPAPAASTVSAENTGTSVQPKRAETFSGFDCRAKPNNVVRRRHTSSCNEEDETTDSRRNSLQDDDQDQNSVLLGSRLAVNNRCVRRASISVVSSSNECADEDSEESKGGIRRMSANLEPSLLESLRSMHHLACQQQKQQPDDCSAADVDRNVTIPFTRGGRQLLISESGSCTSNTMQCGLRHWSSRHREILASLLSHVHSLANVSVQKTTEAESLRAQLAEARSAVSRLSTDNDRLIQDRRPSTGFHHDKQLEELRNMQSALQQEKADLSRAKDLQAELFRQQQESIRQLQSVIDKQKEEIKVQKDEIKRQRDALQRQIDLFEEQRRLAAASHNGGVVGGDDQRTRGGRPYFGVDATGRQRSESPLTRTQSGTGLLQQVDYQAKYNFSVLRQDPAMGPVLKPSDWPLADRQLTRAGSTGSLIGAGSADRGARKLVGPNESKTGDTGPSFPISGGSGRVISSLVGPGNASSSAQPPSSTKLSKLAPSGLSAMPSESQSASSTTLTNANGSEKSTSALPVGSDRTGAVSHEEDKAIPTSRHLAVARKTGSSTAPTPRYHNQQQQQLQQQQQQQQPAVNILPMKLAEGKVTGGSSSAKLTGAGAGKTMSSAPARTLSSPAFTAPVEVTLTVSKSDATQSKPETDTNIYYV